FLILKSGVNHTSRGSISTSTLPSIKLRKCSSKIITSILSFISGRLATKSNQIKQLIRNGRSASLQRTFKKSFTSFSHSTRNKTRATAKDISNVVTDAASGVVDIFHGIDKAVADTWNNFWKDGKADGIGSNL